MEKLENFFKIEDSYKITVTSLIVSLLVGLVAYNLYVIYAYTNPDGIIEGLTSYINAGWHIAGCGRYGLAILLSLSANVNMPFFNVLGFTFFSWLSGFTIVKLWDIKNDFAIITITSAMCVTKSTIDHITTNTVAFPYSLACFLSVLFVYLNFKNKGKTALVLSVLCLTASMSIYQAYIGLSASLALMTCVIQIINNENEVFNRALTAILVAIVSGIVYLIGLKIILFLTGLTASARMAEVSIHNTVLNLLPQIKNMYASYFAYFFDRKMHKEIFYALIIVSIFISSFAHMTKRSNIDKLLIACGIILIPFASNVESLLSPGTPIATNMQYQNILVVPFAICLIQLLNSKQIYNTLLCIVSLTLVWTYIVCANATFKCYQLSYNSINYQISLMIDDVIHYQNYSLNEDKLLFVGYPNDFALKENIKTYKYAYDFDEIGSVVFWDSEKNGYTYNRKNYLINYFGIDGKDISFDEYLDIIYSDGFKEMPIWPKAGSISKINDVVVVKVTNNPYTGD